MEIEEMRKAAGEIVQAATKKMAEQWPGTDEETREILCALMSLRKTFNQECIDGLYRLVSKLHTSLPPTMPEEMKKPYQPVPFAAAVPVANNSNFPIGKAMLFLPYAGSYAGVREDGMMTGGMSQSKFDTRIASPVEIDQFIRALPDNAIQAHFSFLEWIVDW